MRLLRGTVVVAALVTIAAQAPPSSGAGIPRFAVRSAGLELQRPTHPGAFFDVTGRRAAMFG